MIQAGTVLKVVDNSGARTVRCLKVRSGYRARYAGMGDTILISVQTLRTKRRDKVKIKKGEMTLALIVREKSPFKLFSGDSFSYPEASSVILLNKQGKFLGTKVFGSVNKFFRRTKFLKLTSLSAGLNN
jgi:large subunit ribosomal protein L14